VAFWGPSAAPICHKLQAPRYSLLEGGGKFEGFDDRLASCVWFDSKKSMCVSSRWQNEAMTRRARACSWSTGTNLDLSFDGNPRSIRHHVGPRPVVSLTEAAGLFAFGRNLVGSATLELAGGYLSPLKPLGRARRLPLHRTTGLFVPEQIPCANVTHASNLQTAPSSHQRRRVFSFLWAVNSAPAVKAFFSDETAAPGTVLCAGVVVCGTNVRRPKLSA
jgi:hypothetical protein